MRRGVKEAVEGVNSGPIQSAGNGNFDICF